MKASLRDSQVLQALRSHRCLYESETFKAFARTSPTLRDLPTTVLIGGTNGKGSVVAILEAVGIAHGFKTAAFVTPHLLDPKERIRIQGQDIAPGVLADAMECMHKEYEPLLKNGQRPLSFFEGILFAFFFEAKRQKCDFLIVEVGLGGRRDATAFLEPAVTCLTNISKDHAHILGPELNDIAREKASLFETSRKCVLGRAADAQLLPSKFLNRIYKRCSNQEIKIHDVSLNGIRGEVSFQDSKASFHTPLCTHSQIENLQTALTILCALRDTIQVNAGKIAQGLARVHHPARMQKLMTDRPLFVDGAHNADALQQLCFSLKKCSPAAKPILFLGLKKTKSNQQLAFLQQYADIIGVSLQSGGYIPKARLQKMIGCREVVQSLSECFKQAIRAASRRPVVICGSLNLAARMIRFQQRETQREKKIQKERRNLGLRADIVR